MNDRISTAAKAMALGSALSRDERALLAQRTDGDRMAFMDAHRAQIDFGSHWEPGSGHVTFTGEGWEARKFNGSGYEKIDTYSTLREALDAYAEACE